MVMPQRQFSAGGYRYGFNGKENDNEVKGAGNQQDYGMRIYDPRVGRFLSVDPIANEYPELTPYQYASNTPIQAIDLDGLESWSINDPQAKLKRDVEAKLSMLQNPNPKPISFLSINQTRIGPAPPPSEYSRKLREQKLEEYYRNQSLARANVTDPVAAHVGFGVANSAGQMGKAPIDHSIGTYEGLRDGNYWKAGKNAAFLALDLYGGAQAFKAITASSAGLKLAEMESLSGSHFLSRHGSQTSLSSQYQRATTGLTPDGVVLTEVNATRFFSEDIQLAAVNMAKSEFAATGKTTFKFQMKMPVGEGYLKGGGAGSYRTTSEVQAVFKQGELNTIYPVIK
jgi:RHS repeat-associated protein